MKKLCLILFVFLTACASNEEINKSSTAEINTSLRKNINPTTFLSNVLYYDSSLSLSKKDKTNLDKIASFTKQYPSSLKIISFNNSSNLLIQRNEIIKTYLKDKVSARTIMTFETGGKSEKIYSQETFQPDNQFSTRTEIYITY